MSGQRGNFTCSAWLAFLGVSSLEFCTEAWKRQVMNRLVCIRCHAEIETLPQSRKLSSVQNVLVRWRISYFLSLVVRGLTIPFSLLHQTLQMALRQVTFSWHCPIYIYIYIYYTQYIYIKRRPASRCCAGKPHSPDLKTISAPASHAGDPGSRPTRSRRVYAHIRQYLKWILKWTFLS